MCPSVVMVAVPRFIVLAVHSHAGMRANVLSAKYLRMQHEDMNATPT